LRPAARKVEPGQFVSSRTVSSPLPEIVIVGVAICTWPCVPKCPLRTSRRNVPPLWSSRAGHDHVVCLKVNGWRFQGFEDAKIALIEGIINGLLKKRPALTKAILLIGFGLPGENAHAPNEWIDLENLRRGTRAMVSLYQELGSISRTP
jgi:hypothetical protein